MSINITEEFEQNMIKYCPKLLGYCKKKVPAKKDYFEIVEKNIRRKVKTSQIHLQDNFFLISMFFSTFCSFPNVILQKNVYCGKNGTQRIVFLHIFTYHDILQYVLKTNKTFTFLFSFCQKTLQRSEK